jgi:hypothetical protein
VNSPPPRLPTYDEEASEEEEVDELDASLMLVVVASIQAGTIWPQLSLSSRKSCTIFASSSDTTTPPAAAAAAAEGAEEDVSMLPRAAQKL